MEVVGQSDERENTSTARNSDFDKSSPRFVKKDEHTNVPSGEASEEHNKAEIYFDSVNEINFDAVVAYASVVQCFISFLALLAAILAGWWAKRAADTASDNLAAFSRIEDAHLILSFQNGRPLDGANGRYELDAFVRNAGRSIAVIRRYRVGSSEPIITNITLEPGQATKMGGIEVHKIDGEHAAVRVDISFSTPLNEQATSCIEGSVLLDKLHGDPWVLITSNKRTDRNR